MLMVQQCAGQRGQRPAQAEIALGNKGLNQTSPLQRIIEGMKKMGQKWHQCEHN
jgi:hypothetical protein